MNLPKRLLDLREERDIKQKDLAPMLYLKPATYSTYESGAHQPSYDTLYRIAEYYGVTLDYLMGVSEVRNPYEDKEHFTPREVWLVQRFRRLSPGNKIRIDERMTVLLEGQPQEE